MALAGEAAAAIPKRMVSAIICRPKGRRTTPVGPDRKSR